MNGAKSRLGMILFILSEGVFFLLLVLAYVTYHRVRGNGPTAANSLDLAKTGVFSLFLFSSSGTMALAMRGFRRNAASSDPKEATGSEHPRSSEEPSRTPPLGRPQGLRPDTRLLVGGLLATLLLGTVFLVGQGLEYASLLRADVTISRDLFGTTFFTLTGFHGIHVFIGLVLIGVLLGTTLLGRNRRPRPGALEAVSVYWHFVDAVWAVIFSVVYLWAFL